MPVAETELHYENPYQLLVAVILSAQCTDKRVNLITPPLLRHIRLRRLLLQPRSKRYSSISRVALILTTRAVHWSGMAKKLVEDFGGEVPSDLDSLTSLPGVGRKTANVIMSVVYNKATMAVDTHVFRVSERIGLTTNSKTPLATEKALVKHIPEDLIPKAHHWLSTSRTVCLQGSPS